MTVWTKATLAAVLFVNLLVAGCALPPKNVISKQAEDLPWRGRLAVRVEAPQSQSFSAGFELSGNALAGAMTLFNPLGGTAAVMTWDGQTATIRVNGDVQYFQSLSELIRQAIGTEIPVGALFGWLAGDLVAAEGWTPDLSQYASGRITAKRASPAPAVELRLVLDKQ